MYQPYKPFMCTPNRGGTRTLVPLIKEDFEVRQGCDLRLHDERFVGRDMFVVFVLNYCPTCQDTKQMWQAYAIDVPFSSLTTTADPINLRDVCTQRIQWIMLKRADGVLVDYSGKVDKRSLLRLVAPLQQSGSHRCFG